MCFCLAYSTVSGQQVQNASFCVPNTHITSHSYIFLIHRRINVSRTYAHHSKKALARSLPVARTRSSSRLLRLPSGIVAVQCLRCLRSTSIAPSGQQSAWHTHSRPIHGRGMRGGCAAALGAGGAGGEAWRASRLFATSRDRHWVQSFGLLLFVAMREPRARPMSGRLRRTTYSLGLFSQSSHAA